MQSIEKRVIDYYFENLLDLRSNFRRSGLDRIHEIKRKHRMDPIGPDCQSYSDWHFNTKRKIKGSPKHFDCESSENGTQRLTTELNRLTRQVRLLKRAVLQNLFGSRQDIAEFIADVW